MTTETTETRTALRSAGRYSMDEAQEILTLGEANAIQRHYGQEIGKGLYGLELTQGLVWALERREDLREGASKLTSWADMDAVPLAAMNDYFTDAEIEVDPTEPEGEVGKESSPVA